LEDLFAINYRFQGLAEKKPETQETVLVKLVKFGVRSVKGASLDLCAKGGIFPGGSLEKEQDTRLNLRVTEFFKEFFAKLSSPSFDSEQRTG
jgi:hypothetical protein